MKKVLFLLMIITLSLTGFGCAKAQALPLNSFYFEMRLAPEGQVVQTLAFPTFSVELKEKYSEKLVEKYEQDLSSEIYNKVFSNFYLKYWLKFINGEQKESLQNSETISFTRPHVEENRVLFSINYKDMGAWRYYNTEKAEEPETSESDSKESLKMDLITKVETTSYFPYSQTNSSGESVASIYRGIVNQTIKKYFPQEDCVKFNYCFEYRYVTPYERIRSNADVTERTTEGVVHSWSVSPNKVEENKEIRIWARNINAGMWYLIALVSALTLAIIVLTFYIFKKKLKKGDKNAIHS